VIVYWTTGALGVISAASAVVALVASLSEPRSRRAGLWVAASLGSCLVLLTVGLAGFVPEWATGLAGCGFILGVQALATRLEERRSLRYYAAMPREDPDADPPWWPEFEAELRRTTTHLDSTRSGSA
jgi:peptidoglycan/LPS O-acetylase OafA/YrhL